MTRKYNDFDEAFKYLIRSKTDKDIQKSFDLEVNRVTNWFLNHYLNGDSIMTAEIKTRSSYGAIISDMVMVNLYRLIKVT